VDANLDWKAGADHLVLCGDLVDRGPRDEDVLDLVRRLQTQAEQAGGRVHALMGNHELMNLTRDLRYVSEESLATWVDDEPAEDRQAASRRYREGKSQADLSLRAFNEDYPPGYFGRLRAFGPEGEYGAWLMKQPAVIRVNAYVFAHGGLTAEAAALGLDGINRAVHDSLSAFVRQAEVLDALFQGPGSYREIYHAAEDIAGGSWSGTRPSKEDVQAAEGILETVDELAFSSDGPLWYRGNSLRNERIERTVLEPALEGLGGGVLIVGHTPTGNRRVTSRIEGRLYRADVGMAYGADPMALVIRDGDVLVYNPVTLGFTRANREAPQGEEYASLPEDMPDHKIESFLSKGKVLSTEEITFVGRQAQLLTLKYKGLEVRAVFQFAEETPPVGTPPDAWNPRRYQHEVAAYKLDRMFDLRQVPVTVLREIDGVPGAIHMFPESAIDLPYVREHGAWDMLEGAGEQIEHARLFTALIGAHERADMAKMFLPLVRRILIADNSRGFPLDTGVANILSKTVHGLVPETCGPLPPNVELVLHEIDPAELKREIGEYVSEKQIEALLARRDAILEYCNTGAGAAKTVSASSGS
jgi:hypothetical protein